MLPRPVVLAAASLLFLATPTWAMNSRFTDATGNTAFSKEFQRDYGAAVARLDGKNPSVDPLLALLGAYQRPEETAELELTIGLAYNQHTGTVDSAKAVVHFTRALQFDLPEETYLDVVQWRGSSYEQQKNYEQALRDYLRGLLLTTWHSLPQTWPQIAEPKVPLFMHSNDPENDTRIRDYNRNHRSVTFTRTMMMQRYLLIDGVKRVQALSAIGPEKIRTMLLELSPEEDRAQAVLELLSGRNEQPWP